ncbi:MAG TPA: beta-ketoacyl-[acyl-carrier-protein] synthase II [Candidatus Desulfofervidus auxilii]|uniref:3-oxoacyl-[acyl-carrier-protein] synthase 2 n=1 Tax=Desulfofervidus auxilii TaxID=1621989 RepID=A0A7V0I9H7_DESA2|nr:beta-ketoacyl-[acyl-carrier-protein] synthase II [Candidatus Desulfofervidus auxilii]
MRRVVVTGLGLVTPVGIGVEESWEAICAGKSGIGKITRFDASAYDSQIAGEVKGFRAEEFISKKQIKRMDLFIQYALAATRMAMEMANLKIDEKLAPRAGTIVGCGLGGLPYIEYYHKILLERGPGRISPFFVPMIITNMPAGYISIEYGLKGPNISTTTACAAGSHAIGEGYRYIKAGLADIMVVGGTEATIAPLCIAGFCAMKALSTRNDAPQKASRPFDKERDGFVVGEGAGILILEELDHALERGAKIFAEFIGYGATSDAYHITAPSPDGEGAALCMENALKDAGIAPEEVDYINAHGTSTQLNDITETKAIKAVFKDHAYKLAISSTKSMTGHLLGGAGGVETVFTVLSLYTGIIPPTVNYEYPDPECDLDYVPNKARKADIKIAMSNSFGFGGTNATLIFKKFEG